MCLGLYEQLNENVSVISNPVTPLHHIVKHAYGALGPTEDIYFQRVLTLSSGLFLVGMCPVNLKGDFQETF